jgi:hypothetical protein
VDKRQTSQFIKQIMGAYPTFEPTQERLDIWSRLLSDMDYDLAIKRLDKHAATSKFAPSIAEILNPEDANKKKKWEEIDTLSPAAVMQGGYKLM